MKEEKAEIEELLYLDNYCKERSISTLTEIIEEMKNISKSNADADKSDWLINCLHLKTPRR